MAVPSLLAALVLAQIVAAPPASATEHGARTVLISRFNSGDVAYVKVAVERHAITGEGRAHAKVFCHNSDGQPVPCGVIHASEMAVELQVWVEGVGWWGRTSTGRSRTASG